MEFSIENLEYFLLIAMRISAFIVSAPFFSVSFVPRRVKAGLSFVMAFVIFNTLEYEPLHYVGTIGYAALIIKEALAGLILGFAANICTMILSFSGHFVDTEMGFSMVQNMDPTSNTQATVTGNLFVYTVTLIMLVSDMHLMVLTAIIDTFEIIPLGEVRISPTMYTMMVRFLTDYFLIAFRIVLPIFMCILITNVILAILAKIAPQMNMFVVGLQLKVMVGLAVLILIVGLMPAITDFIFNEMKDMIRYATKILGG
ncbi:MAG: flagellar biosynthetic protein FliR [Lachnospiraceae bacterium]|nr:flagellar biosynthetic protein FliR [Lachnospiraceae bacterium]